MYKKGAGNEKQGKDAVNRMLRPYRNFSQAIMGHIRDVRPEWVTFPGRKPADGCKFLTKNLRMGHNFDIMLPGNRRFSSKLNKTYCSLVNFYCE